MNGEKKLTQGLKTVLSPSLCKTGLLGRLGNEDHLPKFGSYPLGMHWSSGEHYWTVLLSKEYRSCEDEIYSHHSYMCLVLKDFGLVSMIAGTVTLMITPDRTWARPTVILWSNSTCWDWGSWSANTCQGICELQCILSPGYLGVSRVGTHQQSPTAPFVADPVMVSRRSSSQSVYTSNSKLTSMLCYQERNATDRWSSRKRSIKQKSVWQNGRSTYKK